MRLQGVNSPLPFEVGTPAIMVGVGTILSGLMTSGCAQALS